MSALDQFTSSQRILVVDDERDILQLIQHKLESAGYRVSVAESGEAALELIARQGLPHLAIVDLTMPGMGGFEFCRRVQEFSDLPVIILTADSTEESIVRGINEFAEDYMTKPFSPRELEARVQRVLRRMGEFGYTLEPITKIDLHFAIDFAHQRAIVKGENVPLTPTETKILYILIRNAGRTVTNDFLLRRLWPHEEVFEDSLRVHIYRLRHKIHDGARYVLTERGIGYSFPKIGKAAMAPIGP